MPESQQLSAGSSGNAADWQRQLQRDRLMGRRYVGFGKLGGPGAAQTPAAGSDSMTPKGGFAEGGAGLKAQLARTAARQVKEAVPPSRNNLRPVSSGFQMPNQRIGRGAGRGGPEPGSNQAAMESYKDSVKLGGAVARGAATGGIAGAAAGAGKELAKQVMEKGPVEAVAAHGKNAALLTMFINPMSLMYANWFLIGSTFNLPKAVKISTIETIAITIANLVFIFFLFVIVVLIASISCPFLPECPVPATDMLGSVVDFVF